MTQLARKLRVVDYFTLGWGTMVGVGWLVVMDDWLGRGGPLGGVLGFAIGGALGGVVLAAWSPADLGWVGGLNCSAALLVHLARGWQARPKPVKIAG